MKRLFLGLGLYFCDFLLLGLGFSQEPATFSFGALSTKARELAARDYKASSEPALPDFLKKLSYDDYQAIHFVPGHGPWQGEGLRFSFQLFHRGFIYHDPVRVHLLEQGRTRDIQFSPAQFDYGRHHFPQPVPADLQFAGLRVLYPINAEGRQDEVAAFLGASYFRVIGAHEFYGASFRGLAIDTAEASGEEFPRFTDFWIEKPAAAATSVRLYALLDSPTVAGAYSFLVQPGQTTKVDVQANLFFRKAPKKIGIAPLTSMFLTGENHTRYIPDFRPEVHDSDGLLIQSNSEQCIWRPLINPPKEHLVSQFAQGDLKGFGLLQRDRQFDHYQDLVARYEQRPSLWVQPREGWGAGSIELVEIPSPNEYNDNMVAYWVPKDKPARGQELHFAYSLFAGLTEPDTCKVLRVEATRITPGREKQPTRFVVDFANKDLPPFAADAPIKAFAEASHGKIQNLVSEKNEVTGGWRAFFNLADLGNETAQLRLFLHHEKNVVTEIWAYEYQQQ